MDFKMIMALVGLSAFVGACSEQTAEVASDQTVAAAEEAAVLPDYAAILAAEDRTEEDKARDASRKPAEAMALMGVKPGQMVIDIGTGGGYYAENLARASAGDGGMVHAVNSPGTVERFPQVVGSLAERREALTRGTIIPQVMEFAEMTFHAPVDVAFMGQMYHEIIRQNMDAAAINAAVFNALKPGGIYAIEIHNGAAGSGREASESYHRADPDIVRAEVLAAGFELVEENITLFANPDDPLDILVFDESIRGNTARTLFIFRKP
ncbi:MAG: class I SAM-dependent methyltransferase [Proteobacteria bacterium]|nr:class I SAM-dependent methyltransferase [Pseudomonadota bacterium]